MVNIAFYKYVLWWYSKYLPFLGYGTVNVFHSNNMPTSFLPIEEVSSGHDGWWKFLVPTSELVFQTYLILRNRKEKISLREWGWMVCKCSASWKFSLHIVFRVARNLLIKFWSPDQSFSKNILTYFSIKFGTSVTCACENHDYSLLYTIHKFPDIIRG